VGVDSNGDAEGAGESKVGNFDATSLVDEQILWLQVSVAKQKVFTVQIFEVFILAHKREHSSVPMSNIHRNSQNPNPDHWVNPDPE
jgi:hypothetical protein